MYNLWIVAIIIAVALVALIVLRLALKDKYDFEDNADIVLFVGAFALIFVTIVAFGTQLTAVETVNGLMIERDLLANLLDEQESFDKIAITQRIVEYNHELAQIIANVKAFGNWSPYTFTDYELLTFIEI